METITIAGKTVCRLGFGCFPLTGGYGAVEPGAAFRTIQAVLDSGVRILDTSDAYAAGQNESLVGSAVADRRDSAVIVTKFGWVLDDDGQAVRRDSSPGHVRKACEASLRRLRTDYIDVYLEHRRDPDVPIEETVGELEKLLAEGKIHGYGLCEVAVSTLQRAAAVSPVAALQTEYSLWSREPEAELLPACRKLGITFMAYSPLGRGFLTGAIDGATPLAVDDFRRTQPRFQKPNIESNRAVVDALARQAKKRGCTPAQIALAWLLAQPGGVIPIPSSRRVDHFEENLKALQIALSDDDVREIAASIPVGRVAGARHPDDHMKTINL